MTSNTTTTTNNKLFASHRGLRVTGIVAAVVIALVIWAIARAFGSEMIVPAWDGSQDQVGALDVIFVGALIPLVGWGLLAVLERFSRAALRIWTITAVAVIVLSIVPLILMTGVQAPVSTTIPLMLIHLAVGAVVIGFFRRSHSIR